VRRLDAWLGRQVQLDAGWSLSTVDGAGRAGTRLTCQGRFEEAASAGYTGLVQAQQRAVAALAARIAADARQATAADTARAACVSPAR
jgi:uncharacterized lipoprotein YmbA